MKTGTALDKMARKGISELKPLIEKAFFFFFLIVAIISILPKYLKFSYSLLEATLS